MVAEIMLKDKLSYKETASRMMLSSNASGVGAGSSAVSAVVSAVVSDAVDGTVATGVFTVELAMPVNLNQYYEEVNGKDTAKEDRIWIEETGCCACAIGNVLSYYDDHEYTILELLANGNAITKHDREDVYTIGGWGSNTVGFGEYTDVENEEELFELVKEELCSGHPVILHCKGIDPAQHWVVAYKYTNGDQLRDNIWVLDSANRSHPESAEGERKTLAASMSFNSCNRVEAYKTTWKK